MGKKKNEKQHKERTSRVNKDFDRTFPIEPKRPESKSQKLDSKSSLLFNIFLITVLLVFMLFINYFIRSIDSFSYLVSFYPIGEPLTYFFISSFAIVIICLLFALYYNELFEKILGNYATVFGIFYGFLVVFLVIYPNSSGYVPIINNPLIGFIFFVLDLAVEVTPFFIGYKIFKNR
jgi:hypothetical protein